MTVLRRAGRGAAIRSGAGLAALTLAVAGCGGSSPSSSAKRGPSTHDQGTTGSAQATTSTTTAPVKPSYPPYPQLLAAGQSTAPARFRPAMRWHGHTAVSVAHRAGGVALLSFNQKLVDLHLHSGTIDAGSSGWKWGPAIVGSERRRLIAAFNGGFRLDTGAGGFMSHGRTALPLRAGLGSIVTYSDGTTDIGRWGSQAPAHGKKVVSVRQNLTPLIDQGRAAGSVGCLVCWGATLGGVSDPARSALGITAAGSLIWAGGEHLTTSQLADDLLAVRVRRAVELDINPEWVNAYLYGHRRGHGPLVPVAVVPGQNGIPGEFLVPWGRDFFTVNGR
ncbi:MAG TPA: hypothetical protein VG321_01735 [Solirubrobacteraceae bacterium]|nr:hypothetical protein [Solirubrobacteraceae bacterium]